MVEILGTIAVAVLAGLMAVLGCLAILAAVMEGWI